MVSVNVKLIVFCVILPLVLSSSLGSQNDECSISQESKKNAPYQLAICTMIQNEALYIREWIEYHRLLKVDHFFIYNDRSTDNIEEVLQPYIDHGIVTLLYWDNNRTVDSSLVAPDPTYTVNQRYCIADCVYNLKHLYEWVGIWDVDEFVHISNPKYTDLPDVVNNFAGGNKWTSLHIPSTVFGPSNHTKRPSGLVIDNYRWRNDVVAFGAIEGKTKGFSGKTMYRSGCATAGVHHSPFPAQGCSIGMWPNLVADNAGNYVPWYPLQLKHYWSKSYQDYYDKVIKWRIGAHLLNDFNEAKFLEQTKTLYEVYDLDMLEFVKPVTQALNCITQK